MMNFCSSKNAIQRSEITASFGRTIQAHTPRIGILITLALSACFCFVPIAAQAQVNPEIANCSELKDEGTVFQADICSAHIGCRIVLGIQKSCSLAKEYLGRLGDAIGEGTRTLFGYRKEVTPDALFTAAANTDSRAIQREKLGAIPEAQRRAQEIAARVRKAGSGEILSGREGVYYGQVQNGRGDGVGTYIDNSGVISRGQFQQGRFQGSAEAVFPDGDRFIGDYKAGVASGPGFHVSASGETMAGTFSNQGFQGTYSRTDGSRFEGQLAGGKRTVGKEYKADGTLLEEGRYDNDQLLVGTRYGTAGVRTEVTSTRQREIAQRAETEKLLGDWAPETEEQRKRKRDDAAQAAQVEQQFRASLQTMNPGQLFARADELNAQGDRTRAREVQRALMSRFPDHPLAATAARQMAGDAGNTPAAGITSASASPAVPANRPTGGRLSPQACDAMKQAVIATKVPPNASVTAAQETVMFMTKTAIDMIDGGCPTNPGVTPSQIAAERAERLQQYTTAERDCNTVQSGGRRCVAQIHTTATASSPPPRSPAALSNSKNTISYDPVTGNCLPYGAAECCSLPSLASAAPWCKTGQSSTGRGIRTAR